jgi:hypothetical protein
MQRQWSAGSAREALRHPEATRRERRTRRACRGLEQGEAHEINANRLHARTHNTPQIRPLRSSTRLPQKYTTRACFQKNDKPGPWPVDSQKKKKEEDPVNNVRRIGEVRAPRIMKTLQYGFPTEAVVVRAATLHRGVVRWGTAKGVESSRRERGGWVHGPCGCERRQAGAAASGRTAAVSLRATGGGVAWEGKRRSVGRGRESGCGRRVTWRRQARGRRHTRANKRVA